MMKFKVGDRVVIVSEERKYLDYSDNLRKGMTGTVIGLGENPEDFLDTCVKWDKTKIDIWWVKAHCIELLDYTRTASWHPLSYKINSMWERQRYCQKNVSMV